MSRPQARRAMELAKNSGLTPAHIAAVQATGISNAGKALVVQNGTDRNAPEVKRLAAEAKTVLGGYFVNSPLPESRQQAGRTAGARPALGLESCWTLSKEPEPHQG